ncbi:hypothetical protein XAP6164_730009 [Xanthomonas phaseoli pv. phaseoli]|nr:hypothetical protein XAP6164_730009 [Xanthomonas phaseoli pv. phaseoli]
MGSRTKGMLRLAFSIVRDVIGFAHREIPDSTVGNPRHLGLHWIGMSGNCDDRRQWAA